MWHDTARFDISISFSLGARLCLLVDVIEKAGFVFAHGGKLT